MSESLPVFPAPVTCSKQVFERGDLRAVRGNTLPIYRGVDYTGKTINDWRVLGPMRCERKPSWTNYQTLWLCQCGCGSEAQWVVKENLIQGRSRGCLNCYGTRNSGKDNGNWKGHGEVPGEMFNRVRNGAKERGIALEITTEQLHDQWLFQNRMCALTGLRLVMGETASLDRIDSKVHYCIGNIQWVHKTVNIMKNDFTEDVFVEMCRHVANHHK